MVFVTNLREISLDTTQGTGHRIQTCRLLIAIPPEKPIIMIARAFLISIFTHKNAAATI
jgi:hypothetical protein